MLLSQMVTYLICDWRFGIQKGLEYEVRQWQEILLSIREHSEAFQNTLVISGEGILS